MINDHEIKVFMFAKSFAIEISLVMACCLFQLKLILRKVA